MPGRWRASWIKHSVDTHGGVAPERAVTAFRLAITLVQPSATVNVHRVPSLVIGWTLCPLSTAVVSATLEASARTRRARGSPVMTDATAVADSVAAGRG